MYLITDIDECSTNSHGCDVNAVCNNTRGSHTCVCQAGYSGDGRTCSGMFLLLFVLLLSLLLFVCVVVIFVVAVDLQWYTCFCLTESNEALLSNYSR